MWKSLYKVLLCRNYQIQGSHTSGKTGKTREFYSTPSWLGNSLGNRENGKNREKPLKFGYRKSLDNIELLPFDRCSFVPLQLRTSEFCDVSLVRQYVSSNVLGKSIERGETDHEICFICTFVRYSFSRVFLITTIIKNMLCRDVSVNYLFQRQICQTLMYP